METFKRLLSKLYMYILLHTPSNLNILFKRKFLHFHWNRKNNVEVLKTNVLCNLLRISSRECFLIQRIYHQFDQARFKCPLLWSDLVHNLSRLVTFSNQILVLLRPQTKDVETNNFVLTNNLCMFYSCLLSESDFKVSIISNSYSANFDFPFIRKCLTPCLWPIQHLNQVGKIYPNFDFFFEFLLIYLMTSPAWEMRPTNHSTCSSTSFKVYLCT